MKHFLFLLTLSTTLITGCLHEDEPTVTIEPAEKKGLVNCNGDSSHPTCAECGNGGGITCCPPADLGWSCDILCDRWEITYDERGNLVSKRCVS